MNIQDLSGNPVLADYTDLIRKCIFEMGISAVNVLFPFLVYQTDIFVTLNLKLFGKV